MTKQSLDIYNHIPIVVAIATDFPASPKVATVGADIVASADPTCTDAEKTSLKEQEAAVETAAAAVEMAYDEAQQTLMGNIYIST